MRIITISPECGICGGWFDKGIADILGFDYCDKDFVSEYAANLLERIQNENSTFGTF